MGPKRHNKKTSKKDEPTKADRLNLIMMELINDNTVISEHVEIYQDVVNEFPNIEVENPIYIRANLELMELKLRVYRKSIDVTIDSNMSSITDSAIELMKNNVYMSYLEKVILYYKSGQKNLK